MARATLKRPADRGSFTRTRVKRPADRGFFTRTRVKRPGDRGSFTRTRVKRPADRGSFPQAVVKRPAIDELSHQPNPSTNFRSRLGPCQHCNDGRFRRFRPRQASRIAQIRSRRSLLHSSRRVRGGRFCTRVAESVTVGHVVSKPIRPGNRAAWRRRGRPSPIRRLECKSDRLGLGDSSAKATALSVFERSAMLAAVGNVGIDRRYSAGTVQDENESLLRGFGWWESSSIGRSLHHGLRERYSIGRSFHSGPSERSSIGRSFHSCPSERSSIGRSFHSCPSERSSIGRSFHSGPSERSSIGRSLQRGPSQRSSIGRSAAHPSVLTGAFPRTPDQF